MKADKKLVRFYLPLVPKNPDDSVWSVIRTGSDATRPADDKYQEKLGQEVTTYMRAIADSNPLLKGIVDRIDFNATTHGQRDIDDLRLSNLIEAISGKRLGLTDVEGDIIGRSYEYLIRKFAEGGGQSAGEFYTPGEVGTVMARILDPEPGMECYDPTCGSAGLIIKLEAFLEEKMKAKVRGLSSPRARGKGGLENPPSFARLKLYGQEFTATTWAMANMNMIIHDMEGKIEIGDTFRNPKLREGNKLRTFDRVVANPMWNQTEFKEADYDADELGRFPKGAGFPGSKADWGWMQHILASLKPGGRAAVVLDTGAASRGSGNANSNKEKDVRQWFIQQDLIEGVIYLPENLFYNTTAPGIIIVLNKAKPKSREGKLFLLNASREFTKGDPKNFIPDDAIARIADTFTAWREEDKYSRIVPVEEIAKNDYNISPSRYIHTGAADEYRPLAEIMEELEVLEEEAKETDAVLKGILAKLTA